MRKVTAPKDAGQNLPRRVLAKGLESKSQRLRQIGSDLGLGMLNLLDMARDCNSRKEILLAPMRAGGKRASSLTGWSNFRHGSPMGACLSKAWAARTLRAVFPSRRSVAGRIISIWGR